METSHTTTSVVIGKGKMEHGMTLKKIYTAKWAGTDRARSRSSSSFIPLILPIMLSLLLLRLIPTGP